MFRASSCVPVKLQIRETLHQIKDHLSGYPTSFPGPLLLVSLLAMNKIKVQFRIRRGRWIDKH